VPDPAGAVTSRHGVTREITPPGWDQPRL